MKNKKRILVTGANGMMGTDIVPIISQENEVLHTDILELDVCDIDSIKKVISGFKPEWVLHMAAMTNLDLCEDEPEKANAINHLGARNVARICGEYGSKLIYISTSGVFSGDDGAPYTEDSQPNPKNVYGTTKYLGELAVRDVLPLDDYIILRVGWLFGGGIKDFKFVGKIYKMIHERDEISAVDDIFGSSNYTMDIGKLILYLLKESHRGIFHAVNEGFASRYEIAMEIVRLSGVKCSVRPIPAIEFPTRAPRPKMEKLDNARLKKIGYKMRRWNVALAEYIERLKCELPF